MRPLVLAVVSAFLLGMVSVPSASVRAASPPFHELWRDGPGSSFDDWTLHDAVAADGKLTLDPAGPRTGSASRPAPGTSAPFQQLIASWNAETPPGTWIEVQSRARIGDRWTNWYSLGTWSSDAGPDRRHSVRGQQDADGRVS